MRYFRQGPTRVAGEVRGIDAAYAMRRFLDYILFHPTVFFKYSVLIGMGLTVGKHVA